MSNESIERFDLYRGATLQNARDGEYVRYSDHERIVKELEVRIQHLMTTREQAERFIRHHLSSAAWSGERLMVTFEQEQLIAALIGDVEAPSPSLSDAIKEVERLYDEWWDVDRRRWLNIVLERLKALSPPGEDGKVDE
jgi:hypothetical protein